MTDETPVPGPEDNVPGEPAPAAEHEMATVTTGAGEFTSGEGLVALAGIVLLLLWLILDVFLDEYGQGFSTLILASIVVIVPRMKPETVEKFHSVPTIMKIGGYGFGLFLLFEVFFLIDSGFPSGALSVIGALVTYAAFAAGFLGARQIET